MHAIGLLWLPFIALLSLSSPSWGGTLSKVSNGTAFMVSDQGHLVTAWHVIKDKKEVFVGPLPSKKWAKAHIVRFDADKDIALLIAPQLRAQPFTLAEGTEIPIGLEVYALGYPRPRQMGRSIKITQGIINGDRSENGDGDQFQFSAEIQQGNSGGPVLAPDGSVVGIAQRKLDALKIAERSRDLPQNVNYAIKSSVLVGFLREAGVKILTKPLDFDINPRPYQIYRQAEGSIFFVIAGQPVKTSTAAEGVTGGLTWPFPLD